MSLLSFSSYNDVNSPSFLSPNGSNFLAHLMADTHSEHLGELMEAVKTNLMDLHKGKRPKGDFNPLSILKHPAVAETDNPEHVAMFKALVKRGKKISDSIPNVHKHIATGFRSYMDNVGAGHNSFEDPRVTQRKQLTASRNAFKESQREVGYKAASAPDYIGGNTKTEKNVEKGDITAGLTLAPARTSGIKGHTACVNATTECENSCLGYTTGKNAMLSNLNSKMAKHQFFAQHPEHAARLIHAELLDHIDNVAQWNAEKKPGEKKLIASYRPNMVSDYNHAHISKDMINHVTQYAKKKDVHFQVRDYTKNHQQLYSKDKPSNYFLALSHTGSNHPESNDEHVSKALDHGHTVASVIKGDATHMYDHKNGRLYPIVDGDDDDQIEKRHEQAGHIQRSDGTGVDPRTHKPTGVVSALRVKGISDKVKKAAGAFENQTTTINHPTHGPMRVVEINKFSKPDGVK